MYWSNNNYESDLEAGAKAKRVTTCRVNAENILPILTVSSVRRC
jgi:hypothetical protein